MNSLRLRVKPVVYNNLEAAQCVSHHRSLRSGGCVTRYRTVRTKLRKPLDDSNPSESGFCSPPLHRKESRTSRDVSIDRLEHLARPCRQACEDIVRRATADQRVEAEAAAGGIDCELDVHDREKHVIPRPFGGVAVEAEPEV